MVAVRPKVEPNDRCANRLDASRTARLDSVLNDRRRDRLDIRDIRLHIRFVDRLVTACGRGRSDDRGAWNRNAAVTLQRVAQRIGLVLDVVGQSHDLLVAVPGNVAATVVEVFELFFELVGVVFDAVDVLLDMRGRHAGKQHLADPRRADVQVVGRMREPDEMRRSTKVPVDLAGQRAGQSLQLARQLIWIPVSGPSRRACRRDRQTRENDPSRSADSRHGSAPCVPRRTRTRRDPLHGTCQTGDDDASQGRISFSSSQLRDSFSCLAAISNSWKISSSPVFLWGTTRVLSTKGNGKPDRR